MLTLHYLIAGFRLSVTVPSAIGQGALPDAFRPFLADANDGDAVLTAKVSTAPVPNGWLGGQLVEQSTSDVGSLCLYAVPAGYRIDLRGDGGCHVMAANSLFSDITISIDPAGRAAPHALSSMLRIAFAQAILPHGAVSLHAAAVYRQGKAYLFMGHSGTGKSTHARLWMAHIPGTQLLNDDNPTVRLVDGRPIASGTPWSGKTPCYKQLSYPVAAMARLVQAPTNQFDVCSGADAFAAILPGCSVIAQDATLRLHLYDTLAAMASNTTVGMMHCRPDAGAATTCAAAMQALP